MTVTDKPAPATSFAHLDASNKISDRSISEKGIYRRLRSAGLYLGVLSTRW